MTAPKFERIIFATEPDGAFGAAGASWRALDLNRIMTIVASVGVATEAVRLDRLLDFEFRPNDLLFYQSAYTPELRAYVREILYFVQERVTIVPRFELLLAHENKGVQEILKRSWNFGNLEGHYHVDFDERLLVPPYVFKTTSGAGSSGVHLVRGARDEARIKARYFNNPFTRSLKLLQRKWVLNAQQFRRYAYYYKAFSPYVTQKFVDDLDGDLKILVFGDRFYTLSRKNRPGDFRASGSGRLDFDTPCSAGALNFARDIATKLNTPFLSLDIAEAKGDFHLLEFQALNFGPTTLTGSSGYYIEQDGDWERVTATPDLEESYAHAMLVFLGEHAPSAK
jgi:hypothetical protein